MILSTMNGTYKTPGIGIGGTHVLRGSTVATGNGRYQAQPTIRLFLLSALLLLTGACNPAYEYKGAVVDPLRKAPEIVGTNWDDSSFRLSDHRGKAVILFFGYTSCPDICPFTLHRMKRLYAQLGPQAEELAVVFVSVDPDRDSKDKLGKYVPGFDPRFFGPYLGRSLSATMRAYDVVAKKQKPQSSGFYAVDHTGTIFVIDPQGMLHLKFPHDAPVDDLLPDVLHLLKSTTDAQGT